MKNYVFLIVFGLFLFACDQKKSGEATLCDLNLQLQTSVGIDSVFISNITQDREFQYLDYKDNLCIDLKDSIDDLYDISFYTSDGEKKRSLLWLHGKNIMIKGRIAERLEIDTIIGSALYYESLAFRKEYRDLLKSNADSATVNSFLLANFKKFIESPFSIEISKDYCSRNTNNKPALQLLYDEQIKQSAFINAHLLNPVKEIGRFLANEKIQFDKLKFFDPANKLTTLKLEPEKRYLIDFWFIGCAPCIEDHKVIAKRLEEFRSRNIEVIGISRDGKQDEWSDFLKKKGYKWRNLREVDVHEDKLTVRRNITEFPTYFIVDNEGTILHRSGSIKQVIDYLGM